MTVMRMAGAASGKSIDWHGIDWASAHRIARRLQMRAWFKVGSHARRG
jgi:RNA-directed DNA polymerase